MKLNVKFRRAALIAVLSLASPAALATLVDQGATTLDTDTNLLWLDMSYSQNNSALSILAGTDTNHLLAAGWSFGSIAQIDTLFADAGISGPFNGIGSSGNYLPALSLVSLLGETYAFTNPFDGTTTHGIQAFSAEGTSATEIYSPFVDYCANCPAGGGLFGVGAADSPAFTTPISAANPGLGSWLVKTATVPEPGTGAMLLAGLGLLIWHARRTDQVALA